jgi:DNA-binding transcriptional LysR family regulator
MAITQNSSIDVGGNGAAPWHGIEVRHLLAFLAVADEGTFSRAAVRLGYTQSAVSQQVGALERMVRTPLFDRPGGPRPVALTPEGKALATHARAVVGRLSEAAAELRSLSSGEQGTLRVGTIQSVGRQILPELLGRFRRSHPRVLVQLTESQNPDSLLTALTDGELDLMFAPVPIPESQFTDGPFDVRFILDDPFVLLAPADSPEAARESIGLDEVVRLPLIGFRSSWCLGLVNDRLAPTGRPPDYVFQSDDNPTIQGLVGAGEGYTMTTLLSIDLADTRTVVLPIEPPVEPRRVVALRPTDRHLPAALEPFVEIATKVCADMTPHTT